jgi:hypothetical protein
VIQYKFEEMLNGTKFIFLGDTQHFAKPPVYMKTNNEALFWIKNSQTIKNSNHTWSKLAVVILED